MVKELSVGSLIPRPLRDFVSQQWRDESWEWSGDEAKGSNECVMNLIICHGKTGDRQVSVVSSYLTCLTISVTRVLMNILNGCYIGYFVLSLTL